MSLREGSFRAVHLRAGSVASGLTRLLLWVIVAYGALLRFEAFHDAYGPLKGSSRFLQTQAVVAGFAKQLRPASIHWARAEMPYRFDAKSYLVSAREMTQFYEARLREPAFVFATKVGLWLTGNQDIAVSLMSSLSAALLVPATYALGRSLGGAIVGLPAALLVAIEPRLIDTGIRGYRDDLFSLLVVVFAGACIRLSRRPSTREAVLTGLIGAAACLTRITALSFVVPGLVAAVAFRGRRWRDALGPGIVSGVLVSVLIAPYLFNCWVAFGDPLYSINGHSAFYAGRAQLKPSVRTSTFEYLRQQFERSPLKMVDSTIRGFTHYPWAIKWAELGLHWGNRLAWSLKYLCLLGLLMWLWSLEGRLTLVLLAASMVPFVFTWEVHVQWRFTEHTYPFYLVAAVFAVARPLLWAFALTRSARDAFGEMKRTLVVTLITAGVAAAFFALVAGLPPLVVYQELASGRPASVGGDRRQIFFMSREVMFFSEGWSPPRTEGNLTWHDAETGRGRLVVPMSGDHGYRVLLRLNPGPAATDRGTRVELRVNDWSVDLPSPAPSLEVGRYETNIPRGVVRTGLNRVQIAVLADPGADAAGRGETAGSLQRKFRFWYISFIPADGMTQSCVVPGRSSPGTSLAEPHLFGACRVNGGMKPGSWTGRSG